VYEGQELTAVICVQDRSWEARFIIQDTGTGLRDVELSSKEWVQVWSLTL
jgi:hypothetical protein